MKINLKYGLFLVGFFFPVFVMRVTMWIWGFSIEGMSQEGRLFLSFLSIIFGAVALFPTSFIVDEVKGYVITIGKKESD